MNTTYANIAKLLPGWLFRLGAQSYIDREYPRHLFIETTALCNLSCDYCPRERINHHMDFNLFRELIDEATKYGKRSFSLHLFGEPLLYPYIKEAISYIKRRNRKHTILLTTNGTKLNQFIDAIREVDQILWTWRTEAKFTEETLGKLKKWGKFRVRFIKEITPESALKEWKDWPNQESRSIHNYGGKIALESFGVKNTKNGQRWPCYHLWLAPAVSWNGNILLCCSDPKQEEILGKFPEVSVHKAWIGRKLAEVRQSHRDGIYKGICEGCDVWKQYPSIF